MAVTTNLSAGGIFIPHYGRYNDVEMYCLNCEGKTVIKNTSMTF
jgi:hypothetical protein